MKLLVTGLGAIAVDFDDVVSVRAEDASGSFGIQPGHADFLTALEAGVLSWRRAGGASGHCAVRHGVLTVSGGDRIAVATREAVVDDDLGRLEATVLRAFRERDAVETSARVETTRMELQALRELLRYLRPDRAGRTGGGI
ncbi:F0F1 ATP synthase subunit epsilon [Pigmentiphaga soli]|uniref:F0F1 ATP synthase subunit epsilon n=1 Tax=Pigmentiphaga soli TaxID=1007095 RepID=A0ABP8HDH4_9BURK